MEPVCQVFGSDLQTQMSMVHVQNIGQCALSLAIPSKHLTLLQCCYHSQNSASIYWTQRLRCETGRLNLFDFEHSA